jgi:hypothetical protein
VLSELPPSDPVLDEAWVAGTALAMGPGAGAGRPRTGNGSDHLPAGRPLSAPPAGRPLSAPPAERPLSAPPAERSLPAAPVFRPARTGQALPAAAVPASAPPARMDDRTEELPIFQQVNNWFQPERMDLLGGSGWQSPADEGWRKASVSAAPEPVAITKRGLPVRIPQRHLVPGAVRTLTDQPQPVSDHRDPDQVAAAMSAYARGVAARRPGVANGNAPTTDPQGSTS